MAIDSARSGAEPGRLKSLAIPLGRVATVAGAATSRRIEDRGFCYLPRIGTTVFLASDASSFVTVSCWSSSDFLASGVNQ